MRTSLPRGASHREADDGAAGSVGSVSAVQESPLLGVELLLRECAPLEHALELLELAGHVTAGGGTPTAAAEHPRVVRLALRVDQVLDPRRVLMSVNRC